MSSQLLKTPLRNLLPPHTARRLAGIKKQLTSYLRRRDLHFQFHIYVGQEWFCADGVPGFAIPFYLLNSEALDLIEDHLGPQEGTLPEATFRYLCHELGHAFDNAFDLRRHPLRLSVFGSPKTAYGSYYFPKPHSKSYVHNLGDHYAQSHPDEDFAETFAAWLRSTPSSLKAQYNGTAAWTKLQAIDKMAKEVPFKKQKLKNQYTPFSIEKTSITLGQFIQIEKRRRYQRKRKQLHCLKNFLNSHDFSRSSQENFSDGNGQPVTVYRRKRVMRATKVLLKDEPGLRHQFPWQQMTPERWDQLQRSPGAHWLFSERR